MYMSTHTYERFFCQNGIFHASLAMLKINWQLALTQFKLVELMQAGNMWLRMHDKCFLPLIYLSN